MRTILVMLIFAACAFAQDKPTNAAVAPGCGPASVKFDVNADAHAHPMSQPEAGKALVYFIEDDTNFLSTPKPTTRLGIDGSWVGANHGNSYFYLSLEPGEHHLCASWQSKVVLLAGQQTAAAHFTAEARKISGINSQRRPLS
jgi:hypothetical protein